TLWSRSLSPHRLICIAMTASRHKRSVARTASAVQSNGELHELFTASEFLLTMVETLWASSANGSGKDMDSASKAHQELERIEQQIAHLETIAGANQDTRQQLDDLNSRVEALRQQIYSHMT